MRLRVDDDIYRVDGVWLGPPQRTLPWRARYIAYAVGMALFVVLQVLERRLGIPISFWSLAYSLLATVALTRLVLTVVDHDRTLRSVISSFGHEVGGPRVDSRKHTRGWTVSRVRQRDRLPEWRRRALPDGRGRDRVAGREG